MTSMRRVTIAFPEDIDSAIWELKKTERFARCSYSEVARYLLELGISKSKEISQGGGRNA